MGQEDEMLLSGKVLSALITEQDDVISTVPRSGHIRNYNPYKEACVVERREPEIKYLGDNIPRSTYEMLRYRMAKKKILYQVIARLSPMLQSLGLAYGPEEMDEIEERKKQRD